MSNIIPDINPTHASLFPYCIWYPDTATEDTYRELARRFPHMKYQVGRACAVAGYVALYRELDLLPDVSIAEEARDSQSPWAVDIFNDITKQHVRYAVMDDYTKTIREVPVANVHLNGDAATRMFLANRIPLKNYHYVSHEYFDINEDGRIGGPEVELANGSFGADDAWMLYSPLPTDLPAVDKDVLILMAAHQGNVDRYVRLRRPVMVYHELNCVLRGIFHSTPFAKWWSVQDPDGDIRPATHARFTMVNDLSWLKPSLSKDDLPYMIWWPLQPQAITLREILRREPRMRPQVAHAAIACGYIDIYNEVSPPFSQTLLLEAQHCANPYFREDLEARKQVKRDDLADWPDEPYGAWDTVGFNKEPTSAILRGSLSPAVSTGQPGGLYMELQADVAEWDLFMCSPVELIKKAEADEWKSLALY